MIDIEPGVDAGTQRLHAALDTILSAWRIAIAQGIEPDLIANAALLTALTDLVAAHGEATVARFTLGLKMRIEAGEFSAPRVLQ